MNLTEIEIPFLPETYNLTDGHAYRGWSESEALLVDRAGELLRSMNRQMLANLERNYIDVFLSLGRQSVLHDSYTYLMCTSASLALEVLANHLRMSGKSLALIEPCFDNLADIFRRHRIPLSVVPDECLRDPHLGDFLAELDTDAVCLVTPNNPTGTVLSPEALASAASYCAGADRLLILDCSFRAYVSEDAHVDHYGALTNAGVRHVIIEDTGKTWPTSELKCPFMSIASSSLLADLYPIYTDMILHVSPFVVALLTGFLELELRGEPSRSAEVIAANRAVLYEAVSGTILGPVETPPVSVSWMQIDPRAGITARMLTTLFACAQVHVLPGDNFYWSGESKDPREFIRIALLRDPMIFAEAAAIMRMTLQATGTDAPKRSSDRSDFT